MSSSPLSPLRWGVLAVGSLLSVAVMVTAGVSLVDWMAQTSYEQDTVLTPAGNHLTIRNSGGVTLTPSPDQHVRVHTLVRYGIFRPKLVQESTSDSLTLEAHCRNTIGPDSCQVTYTVEVPPSLTIDVSSFEGDLSASGLSGAVHLFSAAGDISVTQMSGDLVLRSEAGDVDATALTSPSVDAQTSAGDVRLDFVAAPATANARTMAGDVDVALPPGSTYNVTGGTLAGDRTIDPSLRTSPSGRSIVATSSAGDVRVYLTAG